MRIVRAEERHIAPVWALMRRARQSLQAQGIHQWDDAYPTRETVATDVARGTLFVLEEEDGTCIASVALDRLQSPEYASLDWTTAEPALVVHRLCVEPTAQGRGHARQLMDFAESYASEQGCVSVRLDAYTGNSRSVELYRRRGYRAVGQVHFPRRELPFWCFELNLQARALRAAERRRPTAGSLGAPSPGRPTDV